MSNIFIPKKIRVGFQKRNDTYTGKLAYVIYYDEKGKIRKETSWDGWRDNTIDSLELENSPRNGYIFNKGVQRNGYWGSGRSVVRVYDPRDFEFEVSVDNLIGLLMHSDVSKRDIVEQCVFAWAGKDLVLLPVNSEEYQKSVEYTNKLDKNVSTKELTPGFSYSQKRSESILTYIGYFDWYIFDGYNFNHHHKTGKKHVFYDGKNFLVPAVSSLSSVTSEDISPEFSNIVEKFQNSFNAQPVVSLNFDDPMDYYHGQYKSFNNFLVHAPRDTSYSYHHDFRNNNKSFNIIDFCLTQVKSYNLSFEPSLNYSNEPCKRTDEIHNFLVKVGEEVKKECEAKSIKYDMNFNSSYNYHYHYHQDIKVVWDIFMALLRKNGFGRISYVLKNGSIFKRS